MKDLSLVENPRKDNFRDVWKKLSLEQRLSVSSMLFLLITLPLAVLLTFSQTKLFSRAFLPATAPVTPTVTVPPTPTFPVTPPTITYTPSVTPTPQPTILLNSSSGISCNKVCSQIGKICVSVGTDNEASNRMSWQNYKNSCAQIYTWCDGVMKKTSNKICQGNKQPWTNCACR